MPLGTRDVYVKLLKRKLIILLFYRLFSQQKHTSKLIIYFLKKLFVERKEDVTRVWVIIFGETSLVTEKKLH